MLAERGKGGLNPLEGIGKRSAQKMAGRGKIA